MLMRGRATPVAVPPQNSTGTENYSIMSKMRFLTNIPLISSIYFLQLTLIWLQVFKLLSKKK